MDAKQIAERHIVERYLADQLTDQEAEAFEAYVEAHPEMVREIELATRMKSGLATLRQRGELETAMHGKHPASARRPALFAAAAAVVLIVGAFVALQWNAGQRAMLLASTAQEILGNGHQPLPVAARLLVTRTRGEATEALAVPPPDAVVELRLDLHASNSSTQYTVSLLRVSGSALDAVGSVADATAQPDGSLSVFVRGSALTAGNYLIRVAGGDRTESEFTLRVLPAAP
jgi:hypothetical protein